MLSRVLPARWSPLPFSAFHGRNENVCRRFNNIYSAQGRSVREEIRLNVPREPRERPRADTRNAKSYKRGLCSPLSVWCRPASGSFLLTDEVLGSDDSGTVIPGKTTQNLLRETVTLRRDLERLLCGGGKGVGFQSAPPQCQNGLCTAFAERVP